MTDSLRIACFEPPYGRRTKVWDNFLIENMVKQPLHYDDDQDWEEWREKMEEIYAAWGFHPDKYHIVFETRAQMIAFLLRWS